MSYISNNKPQVDDLVNENIRFKEVLVIDQDGNQLGVKSRYEALKIAEAASLDLVCVAPNSTPPVCRILDYGKHRFSQQKKMKEMRKNQKVINVKEQKMSPTIDIHDFNTKVNQTLKWLEKGDRVKASIEFRGRQMAHIDIGHGVLKRFIEQCSEVATVEKPPKLEGRSLQVVLVAKKK